jgi:membrane-bound lytic murein transglycosylase B
MLIRYGAALAIRCVFCIVLSVSTTIAAECQKDNFGTWLEHFKQEAIGVGISQQTVATALNEGYGRRDLIHSALNALASTANYLKNYGWVSGKPWTEGAANFPVLQKWNESEVYAKTVAYFATRLGKEP